MNNGQIEDDDTEMGMSERLRAMLRLRPLGQEPDILPLYSGKWRDKDDGIRGGGKWSPTYRGRCRGTEFAKV